MSSNQFKIPTLQWVLQINLYFYIHSKMKGLHHRKHSHVCKCTMTIGYIKGLFYGKLVQHRPQGTDRAQTDSAARLDRVETVLQRASSKLARALITEIAEVAEVLLQLYVRSSKLVPSVLC